MSADIRSKFRSSPWQSCSSGPREILTADQYVEDKCVSVRGMCVNMCVYLDAS